MGFLGSKITADGDCSHEIKRCLLLGRKVMTNLDSILKSRDITLPTKVHLVKAMAFPVVMYGCESWTVKKAEHRRIDAFELWCWRRLLRVPWTARRSNQSIVSSQVLTVAVSQEASKVVWYSHLLKNFSVCCDPQSQELLCHQRSRKKEKKVKSLSHVRLFATPCTVARQAPLSVGFSRQEY